MSQLSPHFSLDELTVTEVRRFGNAPPPRVVERLERLALRLEAVRSLLGDRPLRINSAYRSAAVNRAVGGALHSAHIQGWAADVTCRAFGPPLAICRRLAASPLEFDQLIEEGTWVHISFDPRMRREVLTKREGGGYVAGLRDDPQPETLP